MFAYVCLPHQVLANGEVDAAVQTPAFTTRWDNYWIEGILWLVRNLDIDGIYLDGAPYERSVLRRLRRALTAEGRGTGFLLDLHASCAGNPHLPYMELYPYLDSIWFGEQCEYKTFSPAMWLAEVSGVPFGLPGNILGDNTDQWQGLVHGMTCRIYPDPMRCNPRPLWAALDSMGLTNPDSMGLTNPDSMGLTNPRMLGWWDAACPVSVTAPIISYGKDAGRGPAVVATLFMADGRADAPRFAVVRHSSQLHAMSPDCLLMTPDDPSLPPSSGAPLVAAPPSNANPCLCGEILLPPCAQPAATPLPSAACPPPHPPTPPHPLPYPADSLRRLQIGLTNR